MKINISLLIQIISLIFLGFECKPINISVNTEKENIQGKIGYLYNFGYDGWGDITDEKAIQSFKDINIHYVRIYVDLNSLCGNYLGDYRWDTINQRDVGLTFIQKIKKVKSNGWEPIICFSYHSGVNILPSWFYYPDSAKYYQWYRYNVYRSLSTIGDGKRTQLDVARQIAKDIAEKLDSYGYKGLHWESMMEMYPIYGDGDTELTIDAIADIHLAIASGIREVDPAAIIIGPATLPDWAPAFIASLMNNQRAGWRSLGSYSGNFVGTPSIITNGGSIYICDENNVLWCNYSPGTQWSNSLESSGAKWSGWINFGDSIAGDPITIQNGSQIFARGTDNAIWQKSYTSSGWGDWISLGTYGGKFVGNPAVSSDGGTVFVRGENNTIWCNWWNGKQWSGWMNFGGSIASDPVTFPNGSQIFARGTDNAIWKKSYTSSGWGDWISLGTYGGKFVGNPAVSSDGGTVFVRGENNTIWCNWWNGKQWSGWINFGGSIAGDPVTIPNGGQIFARGTDNAIWQKSYTSSGWGDWISLGTNGEDFIGNPGISTTGLYIATKGYDNTIYYKFLTLNLIDMVSMHYYGLDEAIRNTYASTGNVITMNDKLALNMLMNNTKYFYTWTNDLKKILDSVQNVTLKNISTIYTEIDVSFVPTFQNKQAPVNIKYPNYSQAADTWLNNNYYGGVYWASLLGNICLTGSATNASKFSSRHFFGILEIVPNYRYPVWYSFKLLQEHGGLKQGRSMIKTYSDAKDTDMIETYATSDSNAGDLRLIIINKSFNKKDVSINISGLQDGILNLKLYVYQQDRVDAFIGKKDTSSADGCFEGQLPGHINYGSEKSLEIVNSFNIVVSNGTATFPKLTLEPMSFMILSKD